MQGSRSHPWLSPTFGAARSIQRVRGGVSAFRPNCASNMPTTRTPLPGVFMAGDYIRQVGWGGAPVLSLPSWIGCSCCALQPHAYSALCLLRAMLLPSLCGRGRAATAQRGCARRKHWQQGCRRVRAGSRVKP